MDKLEKDINEVVDKAHEKAHLESAEFMGKIVATYIHSLWQNGVQNEEMITSLANVYQSSKMGFAFTMQMHDLHNQDGPADD